jgi:hypothetical protein
MVRLAEELLVFVTLSAVLLVEESYRLLVNDTRMRFVVNKLTI